VSIDDTKGARWERRRVEGGACMGKARDGQVWRGLGTIWKGRGGNITTGKKGNHLYAHTEGTKELDLVLRDELSKCDENAGLECRLTVVVHVISIGR